MSTIKDSGDRTQFDSGAVRDLHEGKGRFDLLPMCVLMRLARHYENGCRKYGPRNWEKGIPCSSYADSALRHICKYLDGYTDEDHLIAAIWNLCGLAWNEEKRPDLMDIPARMEQENTATTSEKMMELLLNTQKALVSYDAAKAIAEHLMENGATFAHNDN